MALLGIASTQWWLIEWLTVFLLPIFYLASLLFWAVTFVASLVAVFMKVPRAWISLTIGVSTILLWIFVPFTELWLRANFWYYREARDEIVAQVQNGSLRPNVEHNPRLISLPADGPQVSMGGNEIVVEEHEGKQFVFFFTFRGILDNYAGFLFVPEGADPLDYNDLGAPCCTDTVKFTERWVWASHR